MPYPPSPAYAVRRTLMHFRAVPSDGPDGCKVPVSYALLLIPAAQAATVSP